MQEEQYGTRDRAYSAWHRRRSISRYVGIEAAQTLSMIDLDMCMYVEYDDLSREPLCLVETARDVGQREKSSSVTVRLAKRAHLPAYLVLYQCALQPNPADVDAPDIEGFRVKRVWPTPESEWRQLDPAAWADALVRIRSWQAKKVDQELKEFPSPMPRSALEPLKRIAAKYVAKRPVESNDQLPFPY
jgi:hypothetical protein